VIAITGATGYLGRALCGALAGRGVAVRRLSRHPDPARGDAFFTLESEVGTAALDGVGTLIHAAHDFRPLDEAGARRVNLEGTRRLLDAAERAAVRRVVFLSSIASYEGARSIYGRTKWAIESEVSRRGGISVRPGLVFGRERGGLFASLDRAVRSLPLLPDFGPAARLFVVHVDDVTRIIATLAEGDEAPDVITAAHPTAVTMRRLIELLAEVAGARARFLPVPPGLALAGLGTLEAAGVRLPFRRDSLISMLNANPGLDPPGTVLGVRLRPLSTATLQE
jgi:nucleoside-diphosphate-sugar epimerase